MAKLVLIAASAAALNGSFRRLGRTWTKEGTVVDASVFSKEDWDVLVNEKMLHIGPAPEGAAAEADAAALRDLVKAALAKLEATDFAEDGQPKADAVRKALPPKTKGVTAELVAEVWAELKAATPA